MNRNFTTGLMLVSLLVSVPSRAAPGEKFEATRLCTEVMKQAGPRLAASDVRNICEATTQPTQVWDCTKKRMNLGEQFGPAVDRCKTAQK